MPCKQQDASRNVPHEKVLLIITRTHLHGGADPLKYTEADQLFLIITISQTSFHPNSKNTATPSKLSRQPNVESVSFTLWSNPNCKPLDSGELLLSRLEETTCCSDQCSGWSHAARSSETLEPLVQLKEFQGLRWKRVYLEGNCSNQPGRYGGSSYV